MNEKNPFDEFYELNHPYWTNIDNNKTGEKILFCVENYGESYGLANFIIQSMLFVKKIQEEIKLPIIIGYQGSISRGRKKIFNSFEVLKISNIFRYNLYGILKTLLCIPNIFSCKDGDSLLKFCIDSMPVGEYIYDSILRESQLLTIYSISNKERFFMLRYVYYFFSFLKFAKKENISYFVYRDCDYLRSAFVMACKKLKIRIFEVNAGILREHKETTTKLINGKQITYSQYKQFVALQNYKKIVEDVNKGHFLGEKYAVDPLAFKGKKAYTKTELFNLFGLHDDKPCVLVAAHEFADTCHYSYDLIFRDYFDWFIKTLEILSKESKYHIFIKEHPSAKFYGKQGAVAAVMEKLNLSNMHMIPSDMNTLCLFDFMDCIVTCCGTIGLEAACFGIPVITASKGYYYGYGLDYNCDDFESYVKTLKNIDQMKKRPEIIENARIVLALVFSKYSQSKPSIFPDENFAEDFILGDYKHLSDCEKLTIINERMKKYSPKDEYYNTQLEKIVILNDECCPSRIENKLLNP